MSINRDPVFEPPVGASVEKGMMPLAVLEEVRIRGLILVGLWILVVLRRSAHVGMIPLAVVITVLLINMGESVLFYPGSVGLLQLILGSWAVSMGFGKKRSGRLGT